MSPGGACLLMRAKAGAFAGFLSESGGEAMKQNSIRRFSSAVVLSLLALTLWTREAFAESMKIEGTIKARTGDTMTLQTTERSTLDVELTDSTDAAQLQGAFKARNRRCPWPPSFQDFVFRSRQPITASSSGWRPRSGSRRMTLSRLKPSRPACTKPGCKLRPTRLS